MGLTLLGLVDRCRRLSPDLHHHSSCSSLISLLFSIPRFFFSECPPERGEERGTRERDTEGERERDTEGERERDAEGERERERERKRVRERETEGERERETEGKR